MPTLTEIFAAGLIGGAVAVSTWRIIKMWLAFRRRALKLKLEVDTSGFTETIERLGQDMQRQVEEVIAGMDTEDIVRAMMGRRMTEQLDEELMTGVEATTETIPPGAIPYTTSHTRPPDHDRVYREQVERDATRIMATHGCTWEEAMTRAEANFTIEEEPPGPLPFIDPATGQFTDRDPALSLPNPVGYAREQAASPGERQSAPLLEWMLDSCRLCSQFVMTNTTIDDSEQAMLCGEGANEPCNVFGMWLAEPDPPQADSPPIVYIWMDNRCPIRCHLYDPTHDLHEHAQACRACFMYAGWYDGGGHGRPDLAAREELTEPLPQDLAPSDVQADARTDSPRLPWTDNDGNIRVWCDRTGRYRIAGRADDDQVALVPARCPWMDPAFCDGCRSRVARLCPQDQAVRCAGQNEPPGQGHLCNIFHGWSLGHPGHPHLALLRSASACDRGVVRVIRFKR